MSDEIRKFRVFQVAWYEDGLHKIFGPEANPGDAVAKALKPDLYESDEGQVQGIYMSIELNKPWSEAQERILESKNYKLINDGRKGLLLVNG